MYAIVNIAERQFMVVKDEQVIVRRLVGEDGKALEFSDVGLIVNDGKIRVGTPAIKGASVTARIVDHLRGEKIIIFKKKRRKGYQKQSGHRQDLTRIQIDGITA